MPKATLGSLWQSTQTTALPVGPLPDGGQPRRFAVFVAAVAVQAAQQVLADKDLVAGTAGGLSLRRTGKNRAVMQGLVAAAVVALAAVAVGGGPFNIAGDMTV